MTCDRWVFARAVRASLVLAALAAGLPAVAFSQVSTCSDDLKQASGAFTRVCMPAPGRWNGDLVVFAHGYVSPAEPVGIPEDQLTLPDGTSIPGIVNGLGFGFATTSYRENGLAIRYGVEDLKDAVKAFVDEEGSPRRTYLVGASEGGLVTTLAVEQEPETFSGGVATCGPVGDFRGQVDHWGDFRALFDYFYPGKLPPSAVNVPEVVKDQWDTVYAPRIEAAFRLSPQRLNTLLKVARVPFAPAALDTNVATALDLLWYNVFATNDANDKLGGNPFDNSNRLYLGSGNDFWLNLLVKRYYADAPALAEIGERYQTSGRLEAPLVTMHTTGDPIVPYWHEPLYTLKALPSGLLHTNLPVVRYGHCRFTAEEALVALGLLVLKVEGRERLNAERVLTTETARRRYRSLARLYGLRR